MSTSDNYHPGVYVQSRSTKRTSSIIISSKEITFAHGYNNKKKIKKNTKKNKNHLNMKNLNTLNQLNNLNNMNNSNNSLNNPIIQQNNALPNNINNITPNGNNTLNTTNIPVINNVNTIPIEHGSFNKFDDDIDDDICSITSQQSFFFHPKNYYKYLPKMNRNVNNNNINKSPSTSSNYNAPSIAATVDELELLPSIEELINYSKHKQLGIGTDAHVYEVVDKRDKSHVAMKLTKRKSGRYRTEIHLLHQLRSCEYIVKLLKVLEDSNVYVLILEQAPMTLEMLLHERCTNNPMKERVGGEIMYDLLRGIRAIHNLGFVHKDIKPENILIFADRINRKLKAKIADFGFATRAKPSSDIKNIYNVSNNKILLEFIERVSDKCGTPGFWAPELVAGCVVLNNAFKMDVFSSGVTLYRMLCNEMPFGLFETWDIKIDTNNNQKKLTKMKPNFQVVEWIQIKSNNNNINNDNIDYIRKLAQIKLSKNVLLLLRGMLRIRPHKRLSLSECLRSPFFKNMQ